MSSDERWNVRIENSCLFIDDAESGRVALQHNAHPDGRPCIHPLRGPDGLSCITQAMPFHHPWQHGVTVGFHGVNGCDFWYDAGQRPGIEIGTINSTPPRIEEADTPKWTIEAIWRHANGTFLLAEKQTWTLQRAGDVLYLDLAWKLQSIPDVTIQQESYGGLFVSVPYHKEIGGEIVNSEGQGREDAEQQRAKWVDTWLPLFETELGGGYAMCDHPSNPGYPSHWRVDGRYGVSPSQCIPGPISLPSGTSMKYNYRLILHVGKLEVAKIEDLHAAYAAEKLE